LYKTSFHLIIINKLIIELNKSRNFILKNYLRINKIKMSNQNLDVAGLVLGFSFLGTLIALEQSKQENFENSSVQYPTNKMFYSQAQQRANAMMAQQNNFQHNNVSSNNIYAGPVGSIPQNQANINLNNAGDQLLAYQLYQQAVNAATPTQQQLDGVSGNSYQQTGNDSPLQGGVASDYAPYNVLGNSEPNLYTSEYQAVNLGNGRADQISACAQNAPTFVATSLLPKPDVPGMDSWDIDAPQDILATQNFLSATQQMGVDTVLSSLRGKNYDLRNTIPNPINVVSPWNMTTITPDLERRPLDCFIPQQGLYGCGPSGCNANGDYVGQDSSSN
jgi:hypothetical protein